MKSQRIGIIVILVAIYTLTVSCKQPSIELNSDLADQLIKSFSLRSSINPALPYDVEAQIEGSTLYFNLESGTDRSSLIPSFEITGKGLQVDGLWQESGSSSQDFSQPVYYELVKTDNSRVQYTVIAGVGDDWSQSLYYFGFTTGLNPGLITESVYGEMNDDTLVFNFPFETNIAPMIPSFGYSGTAVVSYNGVILSSDAAPAINPANGGTLRIDFDDGTTKIYTVKSNVDTQKYLYVSTSGSVGASGSQLNPLSTIEEAISVAQAKGFREIRLAAGNYFLSGNLVIQNDISIKGGFSSSDWSYRDYTSPDIRSGMICSIDISTGSSGTADEHMGTIVYEGSGVSSSTVLEGVRVYGSGGASNFTTAVKVLDGASPTIQYCDLYGSSVNDSSALSVYNSSPRIYSSQIMGNASGYSVGLNVGYNAKPTVVSSRINAFSANTAIAMQLAGPGAGGYFYNNFVEGDGGSQGVAVRLGEAAGSFLNNIFSIVTGMPSDICFWEDGSGNSPDLLENNNFSTGNLGVPLYMKDGSTLINSAADINALSAASGNSDYFFFDYFSFINDSFSQYIPSVIAYDGQTFSGVWPYDLYNNVRSDTGADNWSRGPYETDFTYLGEDPLIVTDIGTDIYDGYWNSLSLREAIHLTNTQDESNVVIFPDSAPTVTLSEPIAVSSDLYLLCSDASLVLDGAGINRHFVIDDFNGSSQSEVFIQGVTFTNAVNSVEGGSIFNLENLYIYDCHFEDNDAPRGGAVYTRDGLLYIANTIFTLNSATNEDGGGIYVLDSIFNGHNLLFALNFTSGSGVSAGSCLYAENSQATITFSTLYDNEAMTEAAVYGVNSDLKVLSSLFNSNVNTVAGPPDETDVYINGGSLELRGSIMETASYDDPPEVTIIAPTFSNPANLEGADSVWMTSDDGLHSTDNAQTMVDHGFEDAIPADWPDADGDGNTAEPFPYDIKKTQRILGTAPDAGAYESY